MRGNIPTGSKSDKIWRDALMRAVRRRVNGKGSPQYLETIASKVVELAAAGDHNAISEVANRLDGKPAQRVEAQSDHRLIVIYHDPTAELEPPAEPLELTAEPIEVDDGR